jgi:EmrB/QacA subfamily drug resistance transporter
MATSESLSPPISAAERRAILSVTCLAAFLFFNSFGSISVALPAIQKQFGNRLAEIQWISLMGVVTVSTLAFCFGRAGSRIGQRRLYKIGIGLYAIGAGLGAMSKSFGVLLGARAVMALGLAMALPMSTAILAASYQPKARGQALGLFASAVAVGRMTGPAIGGFLLEFGGWPWIFWLNFILGLAVSTAVLVIFRGPGDTSVEVFDVWGALFLLIGYPALLIGFTFSASLGWQSALVVGSFVLAALGMAAFVWNELHVANPLIDLAMFRHRLLAGAIVIVALSQWLSHSIGFAAPLYLQNALGASSLLSGLILALLPLATALASPLGGRLADRIDARTVNSAGVGLLVFGIACYAALDAVSPLALVGAVLFAIGVGIGLMTPASQKVAFAAVRQADYGALAALLSSLGTAAGTIGVVITVALMEAAGEQSLWQGPTEFTGAQQFAFACMVPVGLVAIGVALRCRRGPARDAAG